MPWKEIPLSRLFNRGVLVVGDDGGVYDVYTRSFLSNSRAIDLIHKLLIEFSRCVTSFLG